MCWASREIPLARLTRVKVASRWMLATSDKFRNTLHQIVHGVPERTACDTERTSDLRSCFRIRAVRWARDPPGRAAPFRLEHPGPVLLARSKQRLAIEQHGIAEFMRAVSVRGGGCRGLGEQSIVGKGA